MGDSAYSFSLTTFSRNGRLLQIEYALTAVSSGKLSLGLVASDGVVIATDKKVGSKLIDIDTVNKIERITGDCGFIYAGLGPDYRVLVRNARKDAAAYARTYGEEPPLSMIVKSTAALMQEYTQSGGVRPFGCSILACGMDKDEAGKPFPMLYQIDPSGTFFPWRATAIGKNFTNSKAFLEKRVTEDITLEDAIHTALLTLREGFEGEVNSGNIEVGVLRMDGGFKTLTKDEVQDYLDEAN
jgi:20S proteasome subunit alpha 2